MTPRQELKTFKAKRVSVATVSSKQSEDFISFRNMSEENRSDLRSNMGQSIGQATTEMDFKSFGEVEQ